VLLEDFIVGSQLLVFRLDHFHLLLSFDLQTVLILTRFVGLFPLLRQGLLLFFQLFDDSILLLELLLKVFGGRDDISFDNLISFVLLVEVLGYFLPGSDEGLS